MFILPTEFKGPSRFVKEGSDEEDLEEAVAQLNLQSQQATFDKPSQHRHLKALYMKGFVDGKPMT